MSESAQTREERLRELFPLVRKIARRVQRMVPGSDLGDLVGDGCIGLIRAVDTFDPLRGPSLERYASRIVAGAMLNGARRLDPVSERVRRELREADRERFKIAAETGTMPSQCEMEERRPALRRAVVHAYRYMPLSLDVALPAGERLGTQPGGDPAAIAVHAGERRALQQALHTLPVRQQRVVARAIAAPNRPRALDIGAARFAIAPSRTEEASQGHVCRALIRSAAAPEYFRFFRTTNSRRLRFLANIRNG